MSRTKGARGKKFLVPEKLEKDTLSDTEVKEVMLEVEEKFNNFPAVHDPERELDILQTHTVNRKSRSEESNEADTSRMSLPFYLQNLPEGSDQSKLIVAAAQAELILGTPGEQVAVRYGISPAKIESWKDTLITVGAVGRRDRLSNMLVALIEQEIKSLMAISIVTSKDEWVERQNAGDLAHFYAVKSDRLIILLQAFGRVDASRQQYAAQLEAIS